MLPAPWIHGMEKELINKYLQLHRLLSRFLSVFSVLRSVLCELELYKS